MQLRHGARPLSLIHLSQDGIWWAYRIYLYLPRHAGSSTCPGPERPVRSPPHMSASTGAYARQLSCSTRIAPGNSNLPSFLKYSRGCCCLLSSGSKITL